SKGSPTRYEGADFDSFHHHKSEALEFLESAEEIVDDIPFPNEVKVSEVMQPFTSQTVHTTLLDDTYVMSETDPILDELLEEFRDEILDITMADKEADCI
ncbi:hypothetical protein Tco_0516550, partial [Tanacetum coccineum]